MINISNDKIKSEEENFIFSLDNNNDVDTSGSYTANYNQSIHPNKPEDRDCTVKLHNWKEITNSFIM